MIKKFEFGPWQRLLFYISYFYYKIFLFRDVKKGVFELYIAEIVWGINLFLKAKMSIPKKFVRDYYETKFGKFYVNPELLSIISVSPAFERRDIEYLIKLLNKEANQCNRILFIDIGAYLGLYSVIVGNKYCRYRNIKIISLEPSTDYLSKPTFKLLKKNLSVNKIKNVTVKKIGVGSKKTVNRQGIKTDTLDNILGKDYHKKFDVIFVKLDIDDFVIDGLKGIFNFAKKAKRVILFVEDVVKPTETVKILEANEFVFGAKLTEYNSFWERNNA